MIVLDSENPPLALWFIGLDDDLDFMGCLQPHHDEGGVYVFDYRFRYHKDDKVFDSDDEKHWYHVEVRSTPEDAIHKIRSVILKMAEVWARDEPQPPQVDELLYSNYRDFHAFIEAFQAKPYAYARIESKEKVAELLREAK